MTRVVVASVVMAVLVAQSALAQGVQIVNGSFTDGGDKADGWSGKRRHYRDTKTYRSPPASLCVDSDDPKDGSSITQQLVDAGGKTFEIAGFAKSTGKESGLEQYQVAVMSWDQNNKSTWQTAFIQNFYVHKHTGDWIEFKKRVTVPPDVRRAMILLYVKGTGKVWYDDLHVVGAGQALAANPAEGGGASASASEPATKPRGEGTYWLRPGDRVLALGDGVMAEGGVLRLALEDDLDDKYEGLAKKIRLVNAGVVGDSAARAAARVDALIAQKRPTAAVVCFGLNDSYRDPHGYRSAVRAIITKLQDANVGVTVLTPPYIDASRAGELGERSRALDEMVGQLKRVAAEKGVTYADCYTPMKRAAQGGAALDWGDGIHPAKRGKRMMADALQEAWGFGGPLQE